MPRALNAEAELFATKAGNQLAWVYQVVDRCSKFPLSETPSEFRHQVIAGEALFDYALSSSWSDFYLLVIHWSKLIETWLPKALLVPFGRELDKQQYVGVVPYEDVGVRDSISKGKSWEATLQQLSDAPGHNRYHPLGFLKAAVSEPNSALASYLESKKKDGQISTQWTRREDMLKHLEDIRRLRNIAVHDPRTIVREAVEKIHQVLWHKGLVRDLSRLMAHDVISNRNAA